MKRIAFSLLLVTVALSAKALEGEFVMEMSPMLKLPPGNNDPELKERAARLNEAFNQKLVFSGNTLKWYTGDRLGSEWKVTEHGKFLLAEQVPVVFPDGSKTKEPSLYPFYLTDENTLYGGSSKFIRKTK